MGTTKSGAREQRNSGSAEPFERFCTSAFQLSRSAHDHGSKTGRFEAASNLLRHVLRLPNEPPLAGHIESWNVAESGERNFEREMPLWVRRDSDPILICYLSLLTLRNVVAPKQGAHPRRPPLSKLAWAHFLMGYAPSKPILQVDLSGSGNLKASAEIHLRKDDQGEKTHIVQVRLSAAFLNQVRANHTRTLQLLHHSSATGLDQLSRSTNSRLPHSYREYVLSNIVDVVRKTPPSISEDQVVLLLDQIEKSECFQTLLAGLGPIFRTTDNLERTKAFIRQMLVQAVLYPKDGPGATVAFLPDISHQDVRTEKQTSSTATQLFLRGPLLLNDPLWEMWATLVSLSGREKSVHDFSRRAEVSGFKKAEVNLSHELDTLIGTVEQEVKSSAGKLSLQYIDTYRRILGFKQDEGMPDMFAGSFTSELLKEFTFRLAYPRASNRGWVPQKNDGSQWSPDELWKKHRLWMDCKIELPPWITPERLQGRTYDRKATHVAFWIFFLLISAQGHSIDYAFPLNVRNTWDGNDLGGERAKLSIASTSVATGWEIVIENRGSQSSIHPDPLRGSSKQIIESLGEQVVDGWTIRLEHFAAQSAGSSTFYEWQSRITILT